MIYIGIDPGTHTGIAIYDSDNKELLDADTLLIHQAMERVGWVRSTINNDMMVIFEDARQRKWYGREKTDAKLQGAGSIKRDCSIWEDFLKDYDIPFRAVPPQAGGTKWTDEYFKMVTGYKGRTSNHARDAAMLVFGR